MLGHSVQQGLWGAKQGLTLGQKLCICPYLQACLHGLVAYLHDTHNAHVQIDQSDSDQLLLFELSAKQGHLMRPGCMLVQ